MKVAFLSESPADQAALAVLTEGLLGECPEPIDRDIEAHGVTGALTIVDAVFRGLYFNSDAEGLVIVVDCDNTSIHDSSHLGPFCAADCRFCSIGAKIARTKGHIRPIQGRPELKVAIGIAVPAIEAWYLVGKDSRIGEAAWKVGVRENRRPYTRQELKRLVYGTERPSLELETERAIRESRRVIADISRAETLFPDGFGPMAQEIRSWRPIT